MTIMFRNSRATGEWRRLLAYVLIGALLSPAPLPARSYKHRYPDLSEVFDDKVTKGEVIAVVAGLGCMLLIVYLATHRRTADHQKQDLVPSPRGIDALRAPRPVSRGEKLETILFDRPVRERSALEICCKAGGNPSSGLASGSPSVPSAAGGGHLSSDPGR